MFSARLAILVVGLITVVAAPVDAQDYPSRPVTVVVPTGPRGGMEMVARAGTPPGILGKPHSEMKAILALPEVRGTIARYGLIPQDSAAPEELARYVATETARWGDIVRKAGAAGIE
jgi:tripartite-type tricarboxylate transporter receptor subunit TctC